MSSKTTKLKKKGPVPTIKQKNLRYRRKRGRVNPNKGSSKNPISQVEDIKDFRSGGAKTQVVAINYTQSQKVLVRRVIVPDFPSLGSFVTGVLDYYAAAGADSYSSQDYVNALTYLWAEVKLAMSGKILTVKQLPYGIYCLLEALKPTTSAFKNGHISYTWDVSNWDDNIIYAFLNASTPTDASIPVIVGWPVLDNIVVPDPDPEAQALSFNTLISQTSFILTPGQVHGMGELIDLLNTSIHTPFLSDCSVFSSVQPINGDGYAQLGGQAILAMSEVYIKYPFLAKFSRQNFTFDLVRAYSEAAYTSLSAYGAGRQLLSTSIKKMKGRTRNVLKNVDMGDLYQYLGSIVDAAASAISTQSLETGLVPTTLNQLDVFILIREMVKLIRGSAFAQQNYSPDPTGNFFSNYYGPYNEVHQYGQSIMIPTAFAENLRFLSEVEFAVSKTDIVRWLPCFGVNINESSISNAQMLPSWNLATGGTFPLVEPMPDMQLWDLFDITTTTYLATAVPKLQEVINIWNTFMNKLIVVIDIERFDPQSSLNATSLLPCTKYFAQMPSRSVEGGVEPPIVSATIPKTVTVSAAKTLAPTHSKKKLSYSPTSASGRTTLEKRLSQIIWPDKRGRDKIVVARTSNGPFSSALEGVLGNMIWPSEFTPNIKEDQLSIDYYQSLYYETFRIEGNYSVQVDNGNQITGTSFTQELEAMCVGWMKGPAQPSAGNAKELAEMESTNVGGFFSSTILDLVGSQLGLPPEMVKLGRIITDMLPV